MQQEFSLSPRIDTAACRAAFAAHRRLEIRDFLADGQAERLRAHLLARDDWMLVMNAGDKVYEIPRRAYAEMAGEQLEGLDRRVIEAARHGFQYRYESIRVPDDDSERCARDTLLDRFIGFMSSEPVLALIGEIIGAEDLGFADGQATAYSSGHFLTSHDDDVEGKNRRAAYVFGLAPKWRTEWGGLLMFHRADGNVEEAFVPAMSALRIFAVPLLHSVSYVTPMAPEARLAVTGWLRTGAG